MILLDVQRMIRPREGWRTHAPKPAPRRVRLRYSRRTGWRSGNACVITSYSIHYTKLYDLVGYIQADIWVRFQRMQGHQVHYVCADDTHGTPVMLRAEKEGVTPEQLINRVHGEHLRDFTDFSVAFDNYHSTHSDENRWFAEDIYGKLKAAGLIETRSIEQFYDPVKNMFLPDRFIKGECPKCHASYNFV